MRRDKQERHGRLCGLIEGVVAENRADGEPAIFEEQEWAVAPLPTWAEWLGVSVDVITDLIKVAPIRKTYTQVEGRKAVLLRVGDAVPMTPREIANIMKAQFRAKTGRNPRNEDYPLLKTLAEEWPDGCQIDIFQLVLDEWPKFKAGVAIEVEQLIAAGEQGEHRYHKFPSVSVVRRFSDVALELYQMRLQDEFVYSGKHPPDAMVKAYPHLWLHLKAKLAG